ncbi:MAG: hypothetical protein A2W91_08525 [Bacteroidetes bacterium GWF2_38_335]|nr:MAG: hypothetical protein A2W91_08525 [Bacteroidetes bacterium GWF2_38_335]OFY78915.1 MAG: hypothetical protein A2281_02195 [Bacteroidetes bacterium RIFOXYA12_FULL_38_20]HBS85977.1 hypothetical protein [Bacteroidales bacterium]
MHEIKIWRTKNMKTITRNLSLVVIVLAALFLSSFSITAQNNGKITICHFPPGNPDNPQTIIINANALDAHLAHGDQIGNCSDVLDKEIILIKEYPNPYTIDAKIEFELIEKSLVDIKVFNTDGTVVETLVSEEKEAGVYETTFSGEKHGYSSGMFMVKASAQTLTEYAEKSMIIVEME